MMSYEEFAEKMQEISEMNDISEAHYDADELMCSLLISLGYEKGVRIFDEMDKWYE